MTLDCPKVFRPFAVAGLLGLAALASPSRATAQDHTPDPYKPYNSAYDSFVYPTYPNGTGLMPNQNILEGRSGYSGANRFQDYLDSGDLGGDLPFGPRRTGPGVPYYSAYRRYDREYGRVYQPNQEADQEYYKSQQTRHEKYLEYLRERDPKKRAELYREYTRETQKATRDLSAPRSTVSRKGAARSSTSNRATAPGLGRGSMTTPAGRAPLTGSDPSAVPATRPTSPSSLLRGGSSVAPSPSAVLRRSEEMGTQTRSRSRITAPRPTTAPRLP